jgi:hypothetical protein
MNAHDRCTNLGGKNLADIFAIYGRGRELFKPLTYFLAIKMVDLRSKVESVPAYSVMATYQHSCSGNEF